MHNKMQVTHSWSLLFLARVWWITKGKLNKTNEILEYFRMFALKDSGAQVFLSKTGQIW